MSNPTKPIYEIHYHKSDIKRLVNPEKYIPANLVSDRSRINRIIKEASTTFEHLDVFSYKNLKLIERLVKNEMVEFLLLLDEIILKYLETEDEAVFAEVLPKGFQFQCDDELQIIVAEDYPVDPEIRLKANIVNTYFYRMSVSDFYGAFVVRHITSKTILDAPLSHSLMLAVRWTMIGLILVSCAKSNETLEEADKCISMGYAYADAHGVASLNLETIVEITGEENEKGLLEKEVRKLAASAQALKEQLIGKNAQLEIKSSARRAIVPKRLDNAHITIANELEHYVVSAGREPSKKEFWLHLLKSTSSNGTQIPGVEKGDSVRPLVIEGLSFDFDNFRQRIAVKHLE